MPHQSRLIGYNNLAPVLGSQYAFATTPGAWSVYGDYGDLAPEMIANKGVVGLLINYRWPDIESTSGVYDFSGLDHMVDQASSNGFKVSIDITASHIYTPQWVIDGTSSGNKIALIDPAPSHPTFCNYIITCLPWTNPYKQARKDLCAAAAARYKDNPAVEGYMIQYANHHSSDWNVQDQIFTVAAPLNCGTCPKPPPRECGDIVQDQPQLWKDAGWLESTFVNLGKEIFDHAASVWPTQRLKCPIGGMSDIRMAASYSSPAQSLMDYIYGVDDMAGLGQTYANRVYLQRQIFLATWKDGTYYLTPGNKPGTGSPNYIRWMVAWRARPDGPFPTRAGAQNQWGATAGPPNCQLGGTTICGPTCPPPCVLTAAFDKAITYNMDSLEIVNGDGVNPALYDACTAYTLAVGGTPRL